MTDTIDVIKKRYDELDRYKNSLWVNTSAKEASDAALNACFYDDDNQGKRKARLIEVAALIAFEIDKIN